MGNNKYKAQINHIRKHYKAFHIDFDIDIFNKFKELCLKNNSTPTTEIKKFVNSFIKENS